MPRRTFERLIPIISWWLILALAGCPQPEDKPATPKKAPQTPPKAAPDPAVSDLPWDEARPQDPARIPRRPATPPNQVATRYILIKYRGAKDAARAKRSKSEAARRARRIVKIARQKGQRFLDLALKLSEVSGGERGAPVIFRAGQMVKAFEKAAFSMGVGQVSDAVETGYGYYVIHRIEVEEYSTAHILIQYKGAENAPVAITRTKEEAQKKAEKVQQMAVKPEADFAVLAGRFSDSPSRIRGGVLQPMAPGQMPPQFDNYLAAAAALEVGQVSKVVETPFGFHIIKRLLLERVGASHILIAYKESDIAPREPRSRYEAERLARKVRSEALEQDADFAALATKYSDDPRSREKGGDLGLFARGTMLPRFEQIAFGLKVGQISDIVETELGYHIIKRTK